jgi:hypothetical protein
LRHFLNHLRVSVAEERCGAVYNRGVDVAWNDVTPAGDSPMATQSQRTVVCGLCLLLAAGLANAQTRVDLRSQSKNIDLSGAPFTRPVKTGPDLPSNCSVGELFFRTNASPGGNLYGCAAANAWSQLSGGSLAYVGGPTGAITINNGVTPGEIDIDTVVLPRKGSSDTISGVWTFTPGVMFGAGTEPACNASTRGRVVMVQGGAGVADTLRVCLKNAVDSYAWTALY